MRTVLQDRELFGLARVILHSDYMNIGVELGFEYAEVANTITANAQNVEASIRDLFFKWRVKQPDATLCRQMLTQKLYNVNLGSLANMLLTGNLHL